jgi:hypothetical protein
MEAIHSSEAAVSAFKTTRSQNPAGHNVNNKRRESLTTYTEASIDAYFVLFHAFPFLNSNLHTKAELIFLSTLYFRKLWNMHSGYHFCFILFPAQDRSVSTATGYGMDGRGSIPGRGKRSFSTRSIQIDYGAHPASFSVGTGGGGVPFPGSQAAGT